MKLFGGKKREKGLRRDRPRPKKTRQADVVTVQLDNLPAPVVDTAMATHIGTRAYQQDAAFVSPPVADAGEMAFGILCDGMGGMQAGEAASSEAASFMANAIGGMGQADDVPARLLQAVHGANEMLLCFNRENGAEAGTTLCVCLIMAGQLFWASVGDSRIYIVRGGEMARLTRDHNYTIHLQRMVQSGKISQQEADNDPNREALVSYIGAPVLEEIDLNQKPFLLQNGDLLLLCSDGLTKSLPDEEILRLLLENGDIHRAAPLLTAAAFDNSPGAQDNTSVVLMRYQIPPSLRGGSDEPDQQNQRSSEDESGEM